MNLPRPLAIPLLALALASCSGRDVPEQDASSLDPAAVDAYNQAIGEHETGLRDQALSSLNKAISIEPKFIAARWNRGLALDEMGRLEEAMIDFTVIIDAGKEQLVQALRARATCLHRLNRADEAVRDYTRAIEMGDARPGDYLNRGLAHRIRRDFDAAEADFRKAREKGHPRAAEELEITQTARELERMRVETDKSYVKSVASLCSGDLRQGQVLLTEGQWEKAFQRFDFALTLLLGNGADKQVRKHGELIDLAADGYFGRASARLGLGQRKEATEDFKAGLSWRQGSGTPAWNTAVRTLFESQVKRSAGLGREKKHSEGVAVLDAAIDLWKAGGELLEGNAELKVTGSRLYTERGRQRVFLRDYRAAVADLTEALRLDAGNLIARANRGIAHYYLGSAKESLADMDKVLAASPNWAWALQFRGLARSWSGDYEGAQADYESALSADGDWQSSSEARTGNLLAGILYQRGDAGGAEVEVLMAESAPGANAATRAQGLTILAWCSYSRGDHKQALVLFDKATATEPETAEIAAGRALSRLKLGDREAAGKDFERALKANPGLAKSEPVPRRTDGRPYLAKELEDLRPLLGK